MILLAILLIYPDEGYARRLHQSIHSKHSAKLKLDSCASNRVRSMLTPAYHLLKTKNIHKRTKFYSHLIIFTGTYTAAYTRYQQLSIKEYNSLSFEMNISEEDERKDTQSCKKKIRKLHSIRREFTRHRKDMYEHMLNYDANKHQKTSPKRKINNSKNVNDVAKKPKCKEFKQRPSVEQLLTSMSADRYLYCLGIENRSDYLCWMKLFHPDKGGDTAECAKVMNHAKTMFSSKSSMCFET